MTQAPTSPSLFRPLSSTAFIECAGAVYDFIFAFGSELGGSRSRNLGTFGLGLGLGTRKNYPQPCLGLGLRCSKSYPYEGNNVAFHKKIFVRSFNVHQTLSSNFLDNERLKSRGHFLSASPSLYGI